MLAAIEALTKIVESFLDWVNVRPMETYGGIFPPGHSQERLTQMVNDKIFPTLSGLAPATTYFILLSLARLFLHSLVFKPFAIYAMKLKVKPFHNLKEIDAEFGAKDINPDKSRLNVFASRTGRTVASVKKYLKDRRNNTIIQGKIVKFVEALWRAVFYAVFCVLGFYALFWPETASWIKDTDEYFNDWPFHPLSATINFYYQIELGCYLHQLFWTEVKRSDALEMIIHHFVTILLITISYLTNYTRIGANILLIHDISDVFLETAKVCNYTSKAAGRAYFKVFTDVFFAIFAVTFFITRLVLYPRYVVWICYTRGIEIYGCDFIGCYVFLGLLSALQILHVYWFYLISKMLYKICTVGITKDERSDDEEELEDHKDD